MTAKVQPPTLPTWRAVHTMVTLAASQGMTAKETAGYRHLSEETIKQYRKEAIALKGAKNMTQTVAIAIREGII